jgi:hypothetical protein
MPSGPSPKFHGSRDILPLVCGPFQQASGCEPGDLPAERVGFYMRNQNWCRAQAAMVGPACAALVEELVSINALFRLRQAQGVLCFRQRYGDGRLEAACSRASEAGDPSCKTVKGILAAGTEATPLEGRLPGIATPAWLREPGAFGEDGR